jgi:hypothetical protein
MNEVSSLRLYILRTTYLFMLVGLGFMIWPLLLGSPETAEHFRGVTWALLGAVGLLAAVGLRYPLKMIPLLVFELLWKSIWVITIGLPLKSAGLLEGAFADTWINNLVGLVIMPLAIPWGYVFRTYIRAPGDRWSWNSRKDKG